MCAAAAAEPLFSNCSTNPAVPALAPATSSESGVIAPPGHLWSEVARQGAYANLFAGFSCHGDLNSAPTAAFRFADDFTVTAAFGWRVSRAALYAYVPGRGSTVAPIASVNVRIWNGPPGATGSMIVFGDTITNRLVRCTDTAMYRVFNTTPLPYAAATDTNRPIWEVSVDLLNVYLAPGHYWIDWQMQAVDADAPVFCPPATIAGQRSAPNANSLQFRPASLGGAWSPVLDAGKPEPLAPDVPQDFAFRLEGEVFSVACPADFNGDGGVDGADIEAFFTAWSMSDVTADTNLDGGVDGADVEAFFVVWQRGGC
ncbi:MAG: hypothetical protein JSR77_16385 [Planctomycetes bacterium]|nr:hypothetical protein [Planctomycetota bacterium]